MVATPLNRGVWEGQMKNLPADQRVQFETWGAQKIAKVVPLNRWQTPEDMGGDDGLSGLNACRQCHGSMCECGWRFCDALVEVCCGVSLAPRQNQRCGTRRNDGTDLTGHTWRWPNLRSVAIKPTLADLQDAFTPVAFADPSEQRRNQAAEAFADAMIVSDYQEVLALPQVDDGFGVDADTTECPCGVGRARQAGKRCYYGKADCALSGGRRRT